MVKLEFHYIFKHSFETVVRAYFQKYSSGQDQNVTSVTVIEHSIDQTTGVEFCRRRGKCVNVLPSFFRRFFPDAAVEFEEEAWLNQQERWLKLHSYNLTYSQYAQLEEFSWYTQAEHNSGWTRMDQYGTINIKGIGPLGVLLESFAQKFFEHGAKKGFTIMDDLLAASTRLGDA